MRLVLDTNVAFSALLWRGVSYRLLTAVRATPGASIFCSTVLFGELTEVLQRAHAAKRLAVIGLSLKNVLEDYARIVQFVVPAEISPTSTDPDDDHALACALAAEADLIVSGDPDLLNLKHFHGTPIVTPAEAMRRIAA